MSQERARGAIAWMANNPVAANLLVLVIIAGGAMGLLRTKQEIFPTFDMDIVSIAVPYPGAGPEDVEQGILLAVEEAVRGIDGVKRITSTASESLGLVNVELRNGADADKVLADVKTAVDRITSFPEEAEEPTISLVIRKSQVISLVLYGDQDLKALHRLAERVRDELLAFPEITQVEIQGVPPVEIGVEVPKERLEALGLTLPSVADRIRMASVDMPAGTVETKAGQVKIRVADRRKTGPELDDVVLVSGSGGAQVTLADAASVRDWFEDTNQASWFDGKRAVRVVVYRVGDETPTEISDRVKAYAEKLRAQLPPTVGVAVWADYSKLLRARLDLLIDNAAYGLVLVFFTLALFLDLKLALWVAFGIPVSFLGAFLVMPGLDLTINMITLFALIVTLGMVVDDAIVIGENVHHSRHRGVPRLQAAIGGARRMAMPVSFSVLTTMAAFAPLLFVPGVMGKVFWTIPAVVIAVLAFSLAEAFFVLPAHLGHSREITGHGVTRPVQAIQSAANRALQWFTDRIYTPLLRLVLAHRYETMALGIGALAMSFALVISGREPFNFFPLVEGETVIAVARMPYGTPIERTRRVQEALERAAMATIEAHGGEGILDGMFSRLGEGALSRHSTSAGGSPVGSHLVTVELDLVPVEQRDVSAGQIASEWESRLPPIPGLVSLVFNTNIGPSAGAAIDVQIAHRDPEILAKASQEVKSYLEGFSGLMNVDTTLDEGQPELSFKLKGEAKALGLTSMDLARQLRGAFYGAEAVREQRGRNEMKIMARLPREDRTSIGDLDDLRIRLPGGSIVPLPMVAQVRATKAPTSIAREDGRRVVDVTAELAAGVKSSQEMERDLKKKLFPRLRERYAGLQVTMAGKQRERRDSLQALGGNFLLALFVIFALLAIPFRSYTQPFIVMATIPFGFVGALLGHLLMGEVLSLVSVMGIVALSGVVVNDSLVLIDAVNELRAKGFGPLDAVVQGGRRRLRPIFLTSITTFAGLAPLIFETSPQARFLVPMALSLGFGVMFATGITLLIVPSLYLIHQDLVRLFTRGHEPAARVTGEA